MTGTLRVAVIGATGNVGTEVVRALSADPDVDSVLGIARRMPVDWFPQKVSWTTADIAEGDLTALFRGADAVVHLAWAIQPSRDARTLYRINVLGSRNVFASAVAAGVPSLVYASSVGAYGPGPRPAAPDDPVDESWPVTGIRSSFYSRHKAEVERALDELQADHPALRVVRMRPALVFRHGAGSEVRRLFLGPLFPNALLRRGLVPVVPAIRGLRFQCVHGEDVADAYRRAVVSDAAGAFNLAADPVLRIEDQVAGLLGARPFSVSPRAARAAVDLTWRSHLQPTPPGWLDMGMQAPLLRSDRARAELGWEPRVTATEALADVLRGLREGADDPTPPLRHDAGGPGRIGELASGLGRGPGPDRPA